MPASSEARFLLDTNVVSEVGRPRPDARVMAWLAAVDEDATFLSVGSLAEISHGIERLERGKRRRTLEKWLLGDLVPRFGRRLLPIDAAVGVLWGHVVARAERAGRPIGAMDALLAATAERHGLTLVTRNVGDFAALSLPLHDPWHGPVP